MGLVEPIVGLVPAGGGCKELLWRWSQTSESNSAPDYAPLKVFDIIGYAKTASSPQEAKPLLFLDKNHSVIINRNELLPAARQLLDNKVDLSAPKECKFKLSGKKVRELPWAECENTTYFGFVRFLIEFPTITAVEWKKYF